MTNPIKDYVVCHQENDHRPHFFRRKSISLFSVLIVLVFVLTISQSALLVGSDFLAAVLPNALVDMANGTRDIYTLPRLTTNPTLEYAARLKAQDMATYSYFAHNSPSGVTPWHWFGVAGYEFFYAGENLAINFRDSRQVHEAWLASPGHRENILNGNFTEVGIATAHGIYQGQPTTFVVQMFGRPLASAAPTPSTPVVVAAELPEPKPVPTPDPVVVVAPEEPVVEEITKTDTFISVVNERALSDPKYFVLGSRGDLDPADEDIIDGTATYTDLNERLFSSPKMIMNYAYLILAALVLLIIIITLLTGDKKHNRRHIGSAIFLILLMVILAYAYDIFVLSDVLIL